MSQKKSFDLALLGRVLGVASPYKKLFALCIILGIVLAPITVIRPYIISVMVDDHIVKGDLPGLTLLAWIFVGFVLINAILRYIFIYYTAVLGQNVILTLRMRVFRHITRMNLSFLDKTPIGTSTTRTINDIESINNVFQEGVITMIADILAIFAVIGMMFYTSWRLTLAILVVLPLLMIATYIFKEKVKESYQRVRSKISSMNAFLQERITGMNIVQIFNAEEQERQKFDVINKDYKKAWIDSIFYYAIFFPVVELISAFTLALIVWIGARGYYQDTISLGAMIAFPLFVNQLFSPVRMLADKFNTLQMGLVAAERVFNLVDNQSVVSDHGTFTKGKLDGEIEFSNVNFQYEAENPVLKDVTFKVEKGKTIGIIGSTGSGKTTIINLINRFYEIEDGSITIDGVDIKKYELEYLRSRLSLVLQDVFLFYGTVFDNIRLMDESISREKVIESSKLLGAHPFIEKLPGGYDYVLTERGGNLSVGQRQLISFVRALVFDPDILILDEATSSIDTETESVIQYAIEKLIEKRTSLIIAHRLSTIVHADYIMVLDKGEIVEFGPHDELITKENGLYKKLYDIQFVESIA